MRFPFRTTVATAACALACSRPAMAAELEGVALDESILVAGRSLLLNGAGVGMRLMFKVYAAALYLPAQKRTAEGVLAAEGPRRLVITMLRDVSGEDFQDAVTSSMQDDAGPAPDPQVADKLAQLGRAIARQPMGLRKGDTLTLDWLPDTGAVVELNRKPLTAPMRDLAFYNALLSIWLGDKPADARLKTQLLGRANALRVSSR